MPSLLRHHLENHDASSAIGLSHQYKGLSYFPHALEILLHNVLDDEVDSPPPAGEALLPSVVSFLSCFPDYLDIIVQCTRKTEIRSWRTLFAHLPPPRELFEEALDRGLLKTAGGYLIVMHTLEEFDASSEQCVRLLQLAKQAEDWDLCKELARFLMAMDTSGDTLRQAMTWIDLGVRTPTASANGRSSGAPHLKIPQRSASIASQGARNASRKSHHNRSQSSSPLAMSSHVDTVDCFSGPAR